MPPYKQREYIAVFITVASLSEARKIAYYLVKNRLAACVNIVPRIESVFIWKNKLVAAREKLLIVKTRKNYFHRLKKEVKNMHSYQVPEIIAFSITDGNADYLNWVNKTLKIV